MLRTYKFVMRPLAEQRHTMAKWLTMCCWLYNNALEQRRTAWARQKKTINYIDQCAGLTELRQDPEAADWKALPVVVERSALQRLQRAYDAFFRRVKAGEKPGFPRFRSRDRYDSFGVGRVSVKFGQGNEGFVRIPTLGLVRFKMHRPIEGEINNVEISRDAKGRWFVHISCDRGEVPAKIAFDSAKATGIDVGITHFATLTSGEQVDNPHYLVRGAGRLARAQRGLALRTKGSRSYRKARRSVAMVHQHVANQRRNFHYHVARDLLGRYDTVFYEALNIAGLARSMLSKHVLDAGWGQFIKILSCKAEEAGKHAIAVDPRGTSQECSACGAIVHKDLGTRVHVCTCGLTMDRDHNSAINVFARGLRAVSEFSLGPEPCF